MNGLPGIWKENMELMENGYMVLKYINYCLTKYYIDLNKILL